jgi:UDP-hydrolysing UDP-N-acetyl-D-glucosamine 2-epimerase
MRTIGVVTTSRSDYSSLLPILQAMRHETELRTQLIVGGMHLAPEFGLTVKEIEADGFEIADRVETLIASDTRQAIAKSIGLGVIAFADSFARICPEIILIVGDRFEMLSVACAALPLGIPVAHVSGGDNTEWAIDNQVRHALTKMSHLHFVAMEAHARRLIQMGEEPSRVVVTGDPALDLIPQIDLLTRQELSEHLNLELEPPIILVSFHPTTLGSAGVEKEVNSLVEALGRIESTSVLTYPNADPENRIIIDRMKEFVDSRPNAGLFFSLGQANYYSLMAQADLMVGNSSSGLWESPSFRLPSVNIGDRQRGRLRAGNVIDVDADADAIHEGIRRGLSPSFRASLRGLENPYGDGKAAPRVVETLKHIELGPRFLQKPFVDLPAGVRAGATASRQE